MASDLIGLLRAHDQTLDPNLLLLDKSFHKVKEYLNEMENIVDNSKSLIKINNNNEESDDLVEINEIPKDQNDDDDESDIEIIKSMTSAFSNNGNKKRKSENEKPKPIIFMKRQKHI